MTLGHYLFELVIIIINPHIPMIIASGDTLVILYEG